VLAELRALEERFDTRLGVHARDTGSGTTLDHRGDERFPMCSTFKALAAAAVLRAAGPDGRRRPVRFEARDVVAHSPVTGTRVETGMTLEALCEAAVRHSDNTAANLLLRELGGPRGVTAFARSLGDGVTRLDRVEPDLSEGRPGDARDTTSPRAFAADLAALVAGTALAADERRLLTGWLVGGTTGARRIRAGAPGGWRVGSKTGTGGHGTVNDAGLVWPPGRPPVVLAVFSTRGRADAGRDEAVVAAAARAVLPAVAGAGGA
jgi:beta-lactamase class A